MPRAWGMELGDGVRGTSGLRLVLCRMGIKIQMLSASQIVVYT